MLVTADWVLPISRRPIKNGGVLVEGDRIVAVGAVGDLESDPRCADRVDLDGCVLLPGLVNAHTHLTLTALEGLIGPSSFEVWLPRLVKALAAWNHEDFAVSAALGARHCIENGVTVVGDIAYGIEALDAAQDAGIGGVFYWEVLGVSGAELYAELERTGFPGVMPGDIYGTRALCGLSPHSPYTAGPGLLRAVHQAAIEMRAPVAIHAAESTAETQLLFTGEGPLAATAGRLAKGFEPPGVGAVAYLDRMGVLEGATAIHLSQMLPTDVPRLAAAARGVVTCPRSNEYLESGAPDVRRMLEAGIPVGVGTDSLASNTDLDLMSDLRALRAIDPHLTSSKLLEMATAMGAIALGVEDRYGVLECGMQADLCAFRTPETTDPEAALVDHAGTRTLEAVMSGGEWRLVSGSFLTPSTTIEDAATDARERASGALDA